MIFNIPLLYINNDFKQYFFYIIRYRCTLFLNKKVYNHCRGNLVMKKILYLVLKNTPKAHETLEALKEKGFNGTVIGSNSLRHTMEYFPEEHTFLNLRHIENVENAESVMCMFVWDEEVINTIKEEIRNHTNNFKNIKGFMFTKNVEDYEGSD